MQFDFENRTNHMARLVKEIEQRLDELKQLGMDSDEPVHFIFACLSTDETNLADLDDETRTGFCHMAGSLPAHITMVKKINENIKAHVIDDLLGGLAK